MDSSAFGVAAEPQLLAIELNASTCGRECNSYRRAVRSRHLSGLCPLCVLRVWRGAAASRAVNASYALRKFASSLVPPRLRDYVPSRAAENSSGHPVGIVGFRFFRLLSRWKARV
jgi:hypothetical protein